MIKKHKRVKKIGKTCLVGALAAISILSIGSSAKFSNDNYQYYTEYKEYMKELTERTEFKDEFTKKQDDIYQAYKQGSINYSEFNSRMEKLVQKGVESISEYECLDEEEKQKAQGLKENIDKSRSFAFGSLMVFAVSAGSAIGLSIPIEDYARKYEEELSK